MLSLRRSTPPLNGYHDPPRRRSVLVALRAITSSRALRTARSTHAQEQVQRPATAFRPATGHHSPSCQPNAECRDSDVRRTGRSTLDIPLHRRGTKGGSRWGLGPDVNIIADLCDQKRWRRRARWPLSYSKIGLGEAGAFSRSIRGAPARRSLASHRRSRVNGHGRWEAGWRAGRGSAGSRTPRLGRRSVR